VADSLTTGSIFHSMVAASEFFRAGGTGWSARPTAGEFDGVELCCEQWQMEPLTVERVESSFFDDRERFPAGSATFDSAFLMRNIAHEWRARGRMIGEGSGHYE